MGGFTGYDDPVETNETVNDSTDIVEVSDDSTGVVALPGISFNDTIKENIIFELYDNIYNFNSINITIFRFGQDIWFKGKEIATILGYANTNHAIIQHIEIEDRKPFIMFKPYYDNNLKSIKTSDKVCRCKKTFSI